MSTNNTFLGNSSSFTQYDQLLSNHKETLVKYLDGSTATYNIIGTICSEKDNCKNTGQDIFIKNIFQIEEIDIGNTVTEIGACAFIGCLGLTKVVIPYSVKKIGSMSFSNCKALKELSISNGVEYIDSLAFDNCSSLQYVTIPNSISYIGQKAFTHCFNLASDKNGLVIFKGKPRKQIEEMNINDFGFPNNTLIRSSDQEWLYNCNGGDDCCYDYNDLCDE